MADIVEKVLNTRIQLKYDSYSEWTSKNPTLRAGEVAIAYLASTDAMTPPEGSTQHPVLFKVGPGKFNDLPWASALAADVHSWAKKTEADFTSWVKGLIKVTDIDAYSKGEVDSKLSANSTADQKYAKDYADSLAKNYDAAGTAAELIAGLDVTDTAVTGQYVSAVNEVDGKVVISRTDLPTYTLASGSANGTVAFNGADVAVTGLGSAAYTDAKAYDAAGAAATAETNAKTYADGVAASALADAKTYADGLNTTTNERVTGIARELNTAAANASGAMKKASENAGVITTLTNRIGSIPYDAGVTNVVDYIDKKTEGVATEAAVALKASQADLEAEIDRATKAEQANAAAIALLVDSTTGDETKLNSIKELATWIEEHGGEAAEMAEAIAANTKAIGDEAKRADDEEKRLAGLIADNAEDIADNARAIAALNAEDGKVANAGLADVASSLNEAGIAQVEGIKVNNAGHADSADNASQLGGVAAENYATKAYADQAEADAIASANANTAEVIKNYYTKGEADAAFMDATETGNAIDAKITALNLGATYEPIGAEGRAKAYADSLAGNYATAAQGAKADSALQSVEVGTGLKVSAKANNKQTIEIDSDVVFVFNCGNASSLVD